MNNEASKARAMLITMMKTYGTKSPKETGLKLVAMRNEVKQVLESGRSLEGDAITSSQRKDLKKQLIHYRDEMQSLKNHNKIYQEAKSKAE
ncbi:hypothetical protein [Bacillus sp. 165]|uniref:hypothetical protein n=1 Tax=Bacillus sp. 165 TaxID=1529117 RepID=UPI001ADAD5E4|nr:hypothetical protein [Bacillus sp. 165]MBO9128988.1 hypothetical protein [Bacillus sp. 165]